MLNFKWGLNETGLWTRASRGDDKVIGLWVLVYGCSEGFVFLRPQNCEVL